jgi:hypothetical protein
MNKILEVTGEYLTVSEKVVELETEITTSTRLQWRHREELARFIEFLTKKDRNCCEPCNDTRFKYCDENGPNAVLYCITTEYPIHDGLTYYDDYNQPYIDLEAVAKMMFSEKVQLVAEETPGSVCISARIPMFN